MHIPILISVLIFTGGLIALLAYLEKKKTNQFISRGNAMKRDNSFYRDRYIFITSIGDFAAISNAIDRNILSEMKIAFEPNIENGWIRFQNSILGGSFIAALQSDGAQGERYMYHFQLLSWTDVQNGTTRQDVLGANILLTAIEKAFITLDPNTGVERTKGEFKTKLF